MFELAYKGSHVLQLDKVMLSNVAVCRLCKLTPMSAC